MSTYALVWAKKGLLMANSSMVVAKMRASKVARSKPEGLSREICVVCQEVVHIPSACITRACSKCRKEPMERKKRIFVDAVCRRPRPVRFLAGCLFDMMAMFRRMG